MPRRLSRREREVMRAISAGRTTKQIAVLLGIASSTVDWHIANALAKLHAANRAEGVALAIQRGELGRDRWRIAGDGWVLPSRLTAAAVLLVLAIPLLVAGDDRGALPAVTAAPRPAVTVPSATAPSPSDTSGPAPSHLRPAPASVPAPSVPPVRVDPATTTLLPATLPPLLTSSPITASPLPIITPALSPVLPTPALPTLVVPTVEPLPLPTVTQVPSLLPSVPSPSLP